MNVAASSTAAITLRRLRWQVFTATWLCYAGFYVTRKVFSVVKGPLKERLAVDDLGVSHLWTTYLVAYMVGQLVAAALGKRYQSRTILLWGMGLSIACNALIGAVLPSGPAAYWPIFALMTGQGLAQGTGWGHTVGMVANWTRRAERGIVMSFWATCYQLGAVIAKGLAAFVFGWLGLLWSFWGSSLAFALPLALFFFWGHEKPEARGLEPLVDEPVAGSERAAGARRQIGFYTLVLSMGFIYFGFKFLRYALDSWSALIMREHFSLSTEVAGYASTAFDWIGFLGVLASGPISDKLFSSQRTPLIFLMSGGCVVATALLWALGLQSLWLFVGLLGLVGFMAMGPDSLLSGAGAMDVADGKRSSLAPGIINAVGSAGPILQEPVIGWLKGRAGLDAVFLLLVAVAAMAAIGSGAFWWSLRRRGGAF